MTRSIANIIAEHEAARAKTASQKAKLRTIDDERAEFLRNFSDLGFLMVMSQRPQGAEEHELDRLRTAEDELMFELADASCASDDEFFIKAAHILKANPGLMRGAAADILRDYLKRRPSG